MRPGFLIFKQLNLAALILTLFSGTIKAENPSTLLDFKSQIALDYPLDEVRVREDDENWFLRSSGYLTYSVNEQNLRHSYGWWTASGGLAITPNYWISSTFVLQKYSFSYTIGDGSDFKENFGLRVFPLFTYRGTFNQFLNPYEPEKGKCLVDAEAGTLSRAQLGLGLTYAEFDGLGIRSRTQCSIIGFELAVLGSGYDSADDIVGVHVDLWERLIQAGVVLELVNSFGSRATPTLGSHSQTFSWLQLYFEAGFTLQWNTSGKTVIFNEGDVKNEKILISDRFLSPNVKIDKSTTAALMGFKLDFSKWLPSWLKAENIAEIRYYGREYNNFYEISRFEGFNQPYFAFSDLASNRQPRNFFVRNGEVSGAFLRQDISLRSWDKLEIILRNDFLIMQHFTSLVGYTLSYTDTVSVRAEFIPHERLRLGVMGSNVLFGPFERNLQVLKPGFSSTRSAFWLDAADSFILDFYLRYQL